MPTCNQCLKTFTRTDNLARHTRSQHHKRQRLEHSCDQCQQTFTRNDDLRRHVNQVHKGQNHQCEECGHTFRTKRDLNAHANQVHEAPPIIHRYNLRAPTSTYFNYQTLNNVMNGAIEVVRLTTRAEPFRDPIVYHSKSKHIIEYAVKHAVDQQRAIKWHLRLTCEFVKSTAVDERFVATFNSPIQVSFLRDVDAVTMKIRQVFDHLMQAIESFQERGSGWELDICGKFCDVYMARYRPIRGSSYIPLPRWLSQRKCILNIQNDDTQDCFTLCILASIHPQEKNAYRPSKYKQFRGELDCSMLEYPVSINQIERFELTNQLRIDVYGVDQKEITPLRISKSNSDWKEVTLLFIERGDRQHYCLIKDMDTFMRTSAHATFVCRKCLLSFNTIDRRDNHTIKCDSKHQIQQLLSGDSVIIKFKNTRKRHRIPMCFVADIEILIRSIQGPQPDPFQSFTTSTAHHEVLLAAARGVFQCCGSDTREYINVPIEEGSTAMEKIIIAILNIGIKFQDRVNKFKWMQLDSIQWQEYHVAKQCEMCKSEFYGDKCRDHCHLCFRYRMALCAKCNHQYRLQRGIHVFMHNFSGFDSTFVAPALASIARMNNYKLECMAREGDSFIQIKMVIPCQTYKGNSTAWNMIFRDSMSFLPSSLSVLADSLKKEGKDRFHASHR